jgi:hypothetical protein
MKKQSNERTQYKNLKWAAIVKSNALYTCIECGSTENIQAHDPTHLHIDPKDGQCLCGKHHADKHPEVPRNLFTTNKMQQPYWENKSAASLAKEIGVHPRTIYRAVKKLSINKGVLSPRDETNIRQSVHSKTKLIDPIKATHFYKPEMIADIEKLARRESVSCSEIVRTAIQEFLKRTARKEEVFENRMKRQKEKRERHQTQT